jgi:hypothetical protein
LKLVIDRFANTYVAEGVSAGDKLDGIEFAETG